MRAALARFWRWRWGVGVRGCWIGLDRWCVLRVKDGGVAVVEGS